VITLCQKIYGIYKIESSFLTELSLYTEVALVENCKHLEIHFYKDVCNLLVFMKTSLL
jgi:hypothetical protein